MADLDTFFAKKDKKKLKGKKFTTTDEIAKRLEQTERKADKPVTLSRSEVLSKKVEVVEGSVEPTVPTVEGVGPEPPQPEEQPPTAVTPEPTQTPVRTEEEQWNDFKEDDTVDVSNLKITKLNIEEEEEGCGEGGEEGKENAGDEKKDGVWKVEEQKKSQQATICETLDAAIDDGMQDVKATVAAMNANAKWTSSLSKEMAATPLPRSMLGSRRKKAAPDITNAAAFPTLADSKSTAGRKKAHEDFNHHSTDRRHPHSQLGGGSIRGLGNKSVESSSSGGAGFYKPPSLRTNNRFGALTDQGARNS